MSKRKATGTYLDNHINNATGSIAESMAALKAFREANPLQHDLRVITQKVKPKKKKDKK